MEWLTMQRWSPYLVGAGIGVLSWLTFLLSNKPLGCSTAFARTSGMIERLLRGPKVEKRAYYRKFAPVIDWEWVLVLGVFLGALISALTSGTFRLTLEHGYWVSHFGSAPVPRLAAALLGGILMGFGARWAGGCTSGHGISGTLQMAVSSWIAAICFFAGGIGAAFLIFGVLGGGGV